MFKIIHFSKIILASMVGALLGISTQMAYAHQPQKIFSFNPGKLQCQDKHGHIGLNRDLITECSDFTHRELKRGKNRGHLQFFKARLIGSKFEGTWCRIWGR